MDHMAILEPVRGPGYYEKFMQYDPQCTKLHQEIEHLPASDQQTRVSILMVELTDRVKHDRETIVFLKAKVIELTEKYDRLDDEHCILKKENEALKKANEKLEELADLETVI